MKPDMRLKVKGDTFFIPDSNGGVYFRNNTGSFRMEGNTIDQWIENLMPVLDGKHSMEELTDGLPDPYRDRLYEIAESLYRNGFVRDAGEDRQHRLPEEIVHKFGSQIEFLDSFGGSGAYRFQSYRQAKVLAVGSGPFFVSLVAALFESGLPKFSLLITNSAQTNRQRLAELVEHARKTDREAAAEEIMPQKEGFSWREIVQPFDSILYVSQEGDVKQLRALHSACREQKKVLLPAICAEQTGVAGPLVHPDSEGCWESAWRRLHRSAVCKDPQLHAFSSTAGAMLANVIVFELFKTVTEIALSERMNKLFLLDLETLEGDWFSFMPHPSVIGRASAEQAADFALLLERSSESVQSNELFSCFNRLTSAVAGIFHLWEEGDLLQLPLSQCRVQAVDPLSAGPAELLPEMICSGFTHEEARREAGLAGIEAYVSRWVEAQPFVGVGAGGTVAEGVCRGLQKCLSEELVRRHSDRKPSVSRARLDEVEDERCRFYLRALTTMREEVRIGLGEEVSGFPVMWVGTNGRWHGSAGLNSALALRKGLQQALLHAQNESVPPSSQALEVSSVLLEEKEPQGLTISAVEETPDMEILQTVLQILKRNGKRLTVFDMAVEPFMKEGLAGVFGVSLGEEEPR